MSRRPVGSGSVRQRKNGSWEARGYLPDGTRTSAYGKTARMASDKLATKIQQAKSNGGIVPSERLTVETFLTDWLESTVWPTRSPNTASWYATMCTTHLVPGLGRHKLAKLTTPDVQRFIAAKLKQGLAPKTVSGIRGVLVTALDDAVRWRLIPYNVAKLSKGPRQVKEDVEPPDLEQLSGIVDAVSGTRLETPVALALYLGWRQSEVLGLRWRDIDQKAGVIRLRQTVVREKTADGYRHAIRPYGKTKGTTRSVPYPPGLTPYLERQKARIARLREKAGARWTEMDLVCPSAIGTPLDGRNVTHDFKDVQAAAGIEEPITFHALRHTAASLLIAAETPMEQVQKVLGHRQLSTTANIYAHLYPGATKPAMERLSETLTAHVGVPLGVPAEAVPLSLPAGSKKAAV